MKIYLATDDKSTQSEALVNSTNKLIEFISFDELGNISERSDFYSSKIEEIDHNDKINRCVIFK